MGACPRLGSQRLLPTFQAAATVANAATIAKNRATVNEKPLRSSALPTQHCCEANHGHFGVRPRPKTAFPRAPTLWGTFWCPGPPPQRRLRSADSGLIHSEGHAHTQYGHDPRARRRDGKRHCPRSLKKRPKRCGRPGILGHLFPSHVQETRPHLRKDPLCPNPCPAHTTQGPHSSRPRSLDHLDR